ncbi:MAG: ABC transporter ATP-binding protein [Chloroflexota bacterium]|nr:ABC transporter ATP-binding protein [Chloroflexota bacterium]
MQLEGIFDVPPSEKSAEQWTVGFDLPQEWNIGLIVGASGSGKTTVARELFGDYIVSGFEWSKDKSILDDFEKDMSIKEIADLLSSVGFSSPPSWLRPFHVLSNGEQFRVNMARILSEQKNLAVVDEFTSVVDRTVAQIGSAAIAKTVRRRNQKFIAVSCHYDIMEWLQPDWIYQPATNEFASGRYLRRPEINLTVKRVHSSAWQLFRKHHYLNTSINSSAVCFCAFWNDVPVAFTAVLHFPHPTRKNTKREHRTVCLPDYQGIGIGNAMSAYIGSVCKGLGWTFISSTANPAMIYTRAKNKTWKMTKSPRMNSAGGSDGQVSMARTYAVNRLTAAFEYIGAALLKDEAQAVWTGQTPVRL